MSIENQVQTLEAAAEALDDQRRDIESAWGTDPAKMPAGQAERHERLTKGSRAKAREAADLLDVARLRAEKIDQIRKASLDPANVENGFGGRSEEYVPTGRNRVDPWGGLGDNIARGDTPDGLRARALDAVEALVGVPHEGREKMARLIDNPTERAAAELVLAGSDPNYRAAFEKILRNPVTGHLMWTAEEQMAYQRTESSRAAMSLTTSNGGYLVPFTLDPTIVLTNAGAASPFRAIARHETTSTNTWNGVSSAGVTAAWLAEGATVADASPTVGQIVLTCFKGAAFISGSVEIIGDSNIADQLPALIGDAQANLESAAFSTGNGTTAPKGIVTAATTTVTTATTAVFAIADIYSLQQALPARARAGLMPAVVGNVAIINALRQFDTAGGSSYWTNLGQGAPAEVLGLRLAEASGMVGTTTTGSKVLVAGDFDKYAIVDRLGTQLQFQPILFDQATARPTGQSGWFAYWRTGADVLDASVFRTLVIK